MKALLINPAFISAFWSMPKTRKVSGAKVLTPPLGLLTVAALLPKEWELRLVDVAARNVTEGEWNWSELVMITGMIAQGPSLVSLIREAKQRGKAVVVGGPFATSLPHRVLEAGCDFLVSGEAEETIIDLIAAIEGNAASGIFECEIKPDLQISPVPRFDLLALADYASMSVQTSRGCPHDCEFCDIVNLYGRKPRYKTPEQTIAELEALYRLGWRSEVFISDDNFVGSRAHALALLRQLIPWMKSHGEPFVFWTQASINLGRDLEMIDLMTEANFNTVFIGIESPDEEALSITGKHQNIRHSMLDSLDAINRNGLTVMASFVMGLDGERKGLDKRIISFVETSRVPAVLVNTLCAVPNTRLWNRLIEEKRLA
ncbi:MAG: B12-binding domain-containing radical SAM protein, partial [Desulfomonile sp.]|nr:B12-binding domain-containing radical SAM protein [Desulfomonile sp.]